MIRRPKDISGVDVLKSTIELIKLHENGCKIFSQLQNWDHKAARFETRLSQDWQKIEELRSALIEPLRTLMEKNPLINAAELIANKKNDAAWQEYAMYEKENNS